MALRSQMRNYLLPQGRSPRAVPLKHNLGLPHWPGAFRGNRNRWRVGWHVALKRHLEHIMQYILLYAIMWTETRFDPGQTQFHWHGFDSDTCSYERVYKGSAKLMNNWTDYTPRMPLICTLYVGTLSASALGCLMMASKWRAASNSIGCWLGIICWSIVL